MVQEKIKQLKSSLAEVSDLRSTLSLLSWDQQVNMPPGGAQARSDQMSTVSRLAHEKFISPQTGALLEDLKARVADLDPDSDDALLIRGVARRYEKQTRVPAEWVGKFSGVTALAQSVWVEAKSGNNFALFKPHLEIIVEMLREYATFFAPCDHVYDALLDGYEPGMKTAEVRAIFDDLRPKQVALIQALREKPQVSVRCLHQHFDEEKQWNFSVRVLRDMGYNWSQGRLDRSVHPFTTELGHGDIRITTHLQADYFNAAFFSCMHEGGHALYDQGIPAALARTLLDEGASMAIHESQSRLWENLVGRSLPFWKHYYPKLQQIFPQELGSVTLDEFYRAVNRVEPSFIRVEADEATYNLHVMLRLELETGLMEGKYAVQDLPELWRSQMKAYLGVTPPDDRQGVLQDIHWADGLFGYFPTYALGNVIAAQLWDAVSKDHPGLNEQIAGGDFSTLLGWLREKIHRQGAKYEPQELLQRAIGEKIDPKPYIRYLSEKFGQIYSL